VSMTPLPLPLRLLLPRLGKPHWLLLLLLLP
jgi:hypothetical protein